MAEFPYQPYSCLLCPRDIEPDDAIAIFDDATGQPLYAHLSCFLESPQKAADVCDLMLSIKKGGKG